jgi:hypothetical protein
MGDSAFVCPARQVARWGALAGAKGRWKRNLIAKCAAAGRAFDDASVSPVVRQTLWHWAYQLSAQDYAEYAKSLKGGARAPYIKAPAEATGGGAGGGGGGGAGSSGGSSSKSRGKRGSGEGASGGGAGASSSSSSSSSSAAPPSKKRKRGE